MYKGERTRRDVTTVHEDASRTMNVYVMAHKHCLANCREVSAEEIRQHFKAMSPHLALHMATHKVISNNFYKL